MENDAKPFASPDLSALVGNLLSNPAALSMLTSLLGSAGQKPHAPEPPPCEASCPPPPPVLPPAPQRPKDERACLLDALRPFLSNERCEMIDTLLKILELMAVFRRRRS